MAEHAGPARRALKQAEELVESKVGGPARLRVIVLLAAVLGLDTADKGTVSAVAANLQQAFGIGNTEIGVLIAAVSFVGAIFTLPMGVLVDKTQRKRLLLSVISLWTLAMVASGTATSFTYMIATRVFLGAVSAAAAPAVASLTGDFFPARERAEVYGLILAGELVGMGLGFLISGEISSILEWRWSFYVMGLPGAALVWALWRYLPEPARGGQSWIEWGETEVRSESEVAADEDATADEKEDAERNVHRGPREPGRRTAPAQESTPQASGPPPGAAKAQQAMLRAGVKPRNALVLHEDPTKRSLWWAVRYVIRIPTYLLVVVASALGYFFFSGVRGFGMIYLTQHYNVSRSVASALVIVLGIGALVGVVAGGKISAYLLDRKRFDARIVVPGVALVVAVLFFGPGIWTRNVFFGVAMLTLGAAALAAANPPIDAARLDIVPSGLWGRAESGRMALRAALEGSAPILFGLLSVLLGGGDKGLMRTYLVMLLPLVVAASLAIPARRTYPRDVATAAASVKASREARAG
ncbi:MAG TPA: MFS transporter [Gammaproteobacteria bacterium]|nr:MFS transporter [Gammaproteobacteria bacterium]